MIVKECCKSSAFIKNIFIFFIELNRIIMKLVILLAVVSATLALPQKEGNAYTNEAIKQAQNTLLIPKDAEIQKVNFYFSNRKKETKNKLQVQEGIEIGAYEGIPGNQRINLFDILGDQVPSEVVNNLQQQVDQIGRS